MPLKKVLIYISEKKYNDEIGSIIVCDERKALSVLSKLFYGKNIDKLNKVAITGTKGKSTTSFFIKNVFDEYLSSQNKKKAGIISSIETYDGVVSKESTLTTPESLEVYKILNTAYENDLSHFVCEISSIAYKYYRVYGIYFNVGVFLNIGYDHISGVEHENFEDYFSCKIKLLQNSDYVIINEQLLSYKEIRDIIKEKEKDKVIVFGYGNDCTYKIENVSLENAISTFCVRSKGKIYNYEINLQGDFNVLNAVVAIAVAEIYNIDYKYIYKGLAKSRIKGRGEIYKSKDNKKIAIVDYAHNGLSLKEYFEYVKKAYTGRNHICVIGSSGSKAFNRRKEVGQLCYQYCDEIILTTADLYHESFESICSDILEYIPDKSKVKIIEDRNEAIKRAFSESGDNDVIISILGKGNETRQVINGEKVFYVSDIVNVEKNMEKYNNLVK